MLTALDIFEIYYVFENIWKMEHLPQVKILWKVEHLLHGANAPFSIIFSKVFKILLKFFLKCCLKIENDVMI